MSDEVHGADRGSSAPPSFDFDDDAISTLLDGFIETQTGPQSKRVSRPPDENDAGARAAQRTVFQHTSRHEALPLVGDTLDVRERRIELLDALAARALGSARARLLTSAAELREQLGDDEGARHAYEQAALADARDVVVLRALRRNAIRREDWRAAVESLEKEAALELETSERVAALKLLAHVQLTKLGDAAAAEQAASHAAELDGADFVACILAAGARLARGQTDKAARALANAAERWPSPPAQAAVFMRAAELMERARKPEEAGALFRRVLELHPESLPARLGVVRAARDLGEPDELSTALEAAIPLAPATLAAALRRTAAVVAGAAGRRPSAIELLLEATDVASAWTVAEMSALEGDVVGARAALESIDDGTFELSSVSTVRALRLAAELGERSSTRVEVHPALENYVGSLRAVKLDDALRVARKDAQSPTTKSSNADETARAGDRQAFIEALEQELDGVPEPMREGAWLGLAEAAAPESRMSVLLAAEEEATSGAILRLALSRIDPDTSRSALRWRAESEATSGARSAFSLSMAARLTQASEAGERACEAALEHHPGYLPALWSLEQHARSDETRARSAHLQGEADPVLATRHQLRASSWTAGSGEAARYAEAALDREAPNPVLLEHLAAAAGHASEAAGDWMMLGSARLGGEQYLARAARAYGAAGLHRKAAKALRDASEARPEDATLRVRRKDAELHASEFARLADEAMQRAREAPDEAGRLGAFAAMADLDRLARRDLQSARLSLQSISELRPDHVPTARALEWDALRARDPERIRASARRLIDALPETAPERIARRRLTIELLRADPDILQNEIDRILRSVREPLEADPGLARQVLGAAYAKVETEPGLHALIALQASLGQPLERAALALDAAWWLERNGEPGRALEALNTAGDHPLALEAEASLLRAAKRWEDAAAVYREAAERSKDRQRAASLWREAASIYETELSLLERAVAAWEAATRCDVRYRDVYRRLAALYQREGLHEELAQLTDVRIQAGADTPTLVSLLLEKAAQHRRRGDVEGVNETLAECLELDPHHFGALRELVDTHRSVGDWQGAAEALIRIARLNRSVGEQVWAFSQLAEVYHEHLADLPRAEASLRRALALAPAHTEILDRLASVLTEQEKSEEAAKLLQTLVQIATSEVEQRDYRIRLAETVARAGDARQAEAVLEALRVEQSTQPDVILALADHYARQGAGPAESMHLNRAANDLREAIDLAPGDETLWTTLVRVLERRHGPGAASCAASAAIALGHAPSLFEGSVATDGRALGQPDFPLSSKVDDAVAPRGLPRAVRRLFELCEHAFDKMLPFDASAWRLRRPSGAHRVLVDEAGAVAEALGISEPRLRMTYIAPASCMPITGDPPTLVVGGKLHELSSERQRMFLFARALKVSASHMAPALRARPEELDVALLALLQGHDPSRASDARAAQLHDLRKKLIKAVPRRSRDEVESLVLELRGNSRFSTRLVHFSVSTLGDRAALTLTGDVPGAVDALLGAAGHDVPHGHASRLGVIRETAEAWELVRFAISDAHFEARTQAGVHP